MTREEQIKAIAREWIDTMYINNPIDEKSPIDCFMAGAEWADANPSPITATEILIPEHHKEAIFSIQEKYQNLEHDHKIMKEALEEIKINKWVKGSITIIGSEHTLQQKARDVLEKLRCK